MSKQYTATGIKYDKIYALEDILSLYFTQAVAVNRVIYSVHAPFLPCDAWMTLYIAEVLASGRKVKHRHK